jgi:hypothetical protein
VLVLLGLMFLRVGLCQFHVRVSDEVALVGLQLLSIRVNISAILPVSPHTNRGVGNWIMGTNEPSKNSPFTEESTQN